MIAYADMVRRLAKDGKDILPTLTVAKIHAFHMASALNGEAGELLEGVLSGDVENMAEELGDLEFYAEGTRDGFALVYGVDSFIAGYVPSNASIIPEHAPELGVSIATSKIYDIVKKWVIYNKHWDLKALTDAFREYEFWMAALRKQNDLEREDVLAANMAKLAKRYGPDYGYSDKAAQERADKNEINIRGGSVINSTITQR